MTRIPLPTRIKRTILRRGEEGICRELGKVDGAGEGRRDSGFGIWGRRKRRISGVASQSHLIYEDPVLYPRNPFSPVL